MLISSCSLQVTRHCRRPSRWRSLPRCTCFAGRFRRTNAEPCDMSGAALRDQCFTEGHEECQVCAELGSDQLQSTDWLYRAANTVRAFQSLPRSLRRRAASHNIRRLPSRLREKAMSEVCLLRRRDFELSKLNKSSARCRKMRLNPKGRRASLWVAKQRTR